MISLHNEKKWNETLNNLHMRFDNLKGKGPLPSYQGVPVNPRAFKDRTVFVPKVKKEARKEDPVAHACEQANGKGPVGRTGQLCPQLRSSHLGKKVAQPNPPYEHMKKKEAKEVKSNNVHLPATKNVAHKYAGTNPHRNANRSLVGATNLVRNKRKTERGNVADTSTKMSDQKSTDGEFSVYYNTLDKMVYYKKSRKSKYLFLERDDGRVIKYQMHRDEDVGFHNITRLDDENLSKVKKENQDDDDIKTSINLAKWSSDMVHKYIKETIEKATTHFETLTVKMREEELAQRLTRQ